MKENHVSVVKIANLEISLFHHTEARHVLALEALRYSGSLSTSVHLYSEDLRKIATLILKHLDEIEDHEDCFEDMDPRKELN